MTKSVDTIIDDLGGPTKVAGAVRRSPGAIRMWRVRKQIPRASWPDLLDAFPDLTMTDLKATERAA